MFQVESYRRLYIPKAELEKRRAKDGNPANEPIVLMPMTLYGTDERFLWLFEHRSNSLELLADYPDRDTPDGPALDGRAPQHSALRFGHQRGFTLSMIRPQSRSPQARPARCHFTNTRAGRDMLGASVELLPMSCGNLEGCKTPINTRAVTKGRLLDQRNASLLTSGLRGMFSAIQIVSDKTPQTYHANLLTATGTVAARA